MREVPQDDQGMQPQRHRRGAPHGMFGAVLRMLEAQLAFAIMEGDLQRPAHDEMVCWKGPLHQIGSGKMMWGEKGVIDHPPEICGPEGVGYDDGERGFFLNISHHCDNARKDIKAWLAWMKGTVGFDGWRYDFVKGFGPEHVAEYNYHTGNPFSVGEYRDGDCQKIYNWIDQTDASEVGRTSLAFDFPLQYHLRAVFWGSKPFEKLGLWKFASCSIARGWPEKAVTFLDNHDTARMPFEEFPTDPKRLIQGHVFLLTSPGIPCVFWSHYFEKGLAVHDAIKKLCQFRESHNIHRSSTVEVIRSTNGCYVAKVDGSILVKIGDEMWSPFGIDGNWKLSMSGDGWAIWET